MIGGYQVPEKLRNTVLERIVEVKLRETAFAKRKLPDLSIRENPDRFPEARSVRRSLLRHSPAVIAEIKRASPSAGWLRRDSSPVDIARSYETAGAAAISVITEVHHFHGNLEHLASVRWNCRLPLLRKDFLFDRYQVLESRLAGADAVLLIAALLDPGALVELREEAEALGMEALVEVHDEQELRMALSSGATLVGVNARDLRSFEVSPDLHLRLAAGIPRDVVAVAESGIRTAEDVRRLMAAGYRGFLIGEAFMRAASPGAALSAILSGAAGGGRRAG